MKTNYSNKERIRMELEQQYFIKIIIFIEQRNGSSSVKLLSKNFGVNYDFLSSVIEKNKDLLKIELTSVDIHKPENLSISVNAEGRKFFFNNIEKYLKDIN